MSLPDDLEAGWRTDYADVHWYASPPAQLVTPAVVWRPDAPWLQPAGDGAGWEAWSERWLAIAAVSASDPLSAMSRLEAVAVALAEYVGRSGLATWTRTDQPFLDDTTGTPFIVAAAHITRPRTIPDPPGG